jgi:DNA-directed RNA polymerase subunit RPC12/RpoP
MVTTIRRELLCRHCGANWHYDGATTRTTCPYCGKPKDARARREDAKKYAKSAERKESLIDWYAVGENRRARGRRYTILLRKRVFFRITGDIHPCCARCGCDDPRLLEINHKNGGGNKEMQHGHRSHRFYIDIANGTRSVDDLELLCKPCNAIHALELKYDKLPMKVIWGYDESNLAI